MEEVEESKVECKTKTNLELETKTTRRRQTTKASKLTKVTLAGNITKKQHSSVCGFGDIASAAMIMICIRRVDNEIFMDAHTRSSTPTTSSSSSSSSPSNESNDLGCPSMKILANKDDAIPARILTALITQENYSESQSLLTTPIKVTLVKLTEAIASPITTISTLSIVKKHRLSTKRKNNTNNGNNDTDHNISHPIEDDIEIGSSSSSSSSPARTSPARKRSKKIIIEENKHVVRLEMSSALTSSSSMDNIHKKNNNRQRKVNPKKPVEQIDLCPSKLLSVIRRFLKEGKDKIEEDKKHSICDKMSLDSDEYEDSENNTSSTLHDSQVIGTKSSSSSIIEKCPKETSNTKKNMKVQIIDGYKHIFYEEYINIPMSRGLLMTRSNYYHHYLLSPYKNGVHDVLYMDVHNRYEAHIMTHVFKFIQMRCLPQNATLSSYVRWFMLGIELAVDELPDYCKIKIEKKLKSIQKHLSLLSSSSSSSSSLSSACVIQHHKENDSDEEDDDKILLNDIDDRISSIDETISMKTAEFVNALHSIMVICSDLESEPIITSELPFIVYQHIENLFDIHSWTQTLENQWCSLSPIHVHYILQRSKNCWPSSVRFQLFRTWKQYQQIYDTLLRITDYVNLLELIQSSFFYKYIMLSVTTVSLHPKWSDMRTMLSMYTTCDNEKQRQDFFEHWDRNVDQSGAEQQILEEGNTNYHDHDYYIFDYKKRLEETTSMSAITLSVSSGSSSGLSSTIPITTIAKKNDDNNLFSLSELYKEMFTNEACRRLLPISSSIFSNKLRTGQVMNDSSILYWSTDGLCWNIFLSDSAASRETRPIIRTTTLVESKNKDNVLTTLPLIPTPTLVSSSQEQFIRLTLDHKKSGISDMIISSPVFSITILFVFAIDPNRGKFAKRHTIRLSNQNHFTETIALEGPWPHCYIMNIHVT
jgi:hypothetical protein